MSKKLFVLAMAVCLVFAMAGNCFAATRSTQPQNSVDAKLSATPAGIDVTVPTTITMTAAAGGTELTIPEVGVTNNLEIGVLEITNINITAKTPWELVADDAEYFKTLAADAQKLSLVYDDATADHDFSTTADKVVNINVNPKATENLAFTGHTGIVTTAITEESVATIVVTVGLLTA